MSEALKALLAYQQCDEDGVMCKTSRQAVHEVADEVERLTRENADLRSAVDSRDRALGFVDVDELAMPSVQPSVWQLPWTPGETAERFHKAYEQFAPYFGYTTRPDTRKFDPDSANGQLIIAVVRNVLIEQVAAARAATPPAPQDHDNE